MNANHESPKNLKPLLSRFTMCSRSCFASLFLFGVLSPLALAVDTDGDGLDDAWENLHFGSLVEDELGDPDGDGYVNSEEEQRGMDPNVAAGLPGFLLQETWFDVAGVTVNDLLANEKFYGSPSLRELTLGVENAASGDNYGSRFRGTLTAPISGAYTFWISGDDSAELWISDNSSKFNRQRVAWYSGHTNVNQWDKFTTQQSATIYLSAGEKYYIELLHKEATGGDHVSMAWSYEASDLVNVALSPGAIATQSSTRDAGGAASRAIDGNRDGNFAYNSVTHTNSELNSWWQVDLGEDRHVEKIVLYNRTGGSAPQRLSNFRVSVLDSAGTELYGRDYHTDEGHVQGHMEVELESCVCGRIVRVQLLGNNLRGDGILSLAEVEVMESLSGAPDATSLGYLTNWTQESGVTSAQSTTAYGGEASRAIDGNRNGNYSSGSVTHTENAEGSWWEVDLGAERPVNRIALYNRSGSAQTRLSSYRIVLLDSAGLEVVSEDFYVSDGHAPYFSKWDLPSNTTAQKVRVERIGLSRRGDHVLSLAEVEVLGNQNLPVGDMQARQLIPSSVFESFILDPHDPDDDYMPCDWEMLFGFDPANSLDAVSGGAFGDPDGDHIANWIECRLGTDPLVANSYPGALSEEVWTSVPGNRIEDLHANPKYLETADYRRLLDVTEGSRWLGSDTGARIQGYVTAPESGVYTFWLSGDDQVEFWLSTDSNKFNKQLIIAPNSYYAYQEYEVDLAEQSATLSLVAGQSYYIELLHKERGGGGASPVSLAWQPPSEDRTLIPSRYLSSYAGHANDLDNDDLPDDWEISFGLDESDDGSIDPVNGAFGDFDGDGISNVVEFQTGSSPVEPGGNLGLLTRDTWTALEGINLETLTQSERFPLNADSSVEVSPFEISSEVNTGTRLRGYLEAPVTGSYQFWIAGDDTAELWLSSDDQVFGRKRIAELQGYTDSGDFNDHGVQKSAVIELEAGSRYYLEILHKQAFGGARVEVQWAIDDGDEEAIPENVLYSYKSNPNDVDDDMLHDGWEQTYEFLNEDDPNFNADYLAYSDPDRDYIPNYLESYLGTDPWTAQPYVGALSRDLWRGIFNESLVQAISSNQLVYAESSAKDLLEISTTYGENHSNCLRRMRGYFVAPKAGDYYFWLSSRGSAELWLSREADDKYHKERIAHISPEDGHSSGVNTAEGVIWDTYMDQMSEGIYLEEGERYYIEIIGYTGLARHSHISLACAIPGEERVTLPMSSLHSYSVTDDDQDDDLLPDSWESSYGLNPDDNGFTHYGKDGERGDFDSDGLSNREEYLIGTDPANPDSDGDGVSDFDEHHSYGTDPTVSDVTPETLVDTIDLLTIPTLGEEWIPSGGGGLLATSFRGSGSWNFETSSHGHWVVQMSAQMRGDLRFEERLPVIASINGNKVLRTVILFRGEVPGTLRFLTPWLPAGQHEFSLFIDNNTIRRSLEVNSIQILKPGGTDLDRSGLPDWADQEIAQRSHSVDGEQRSYISPAFIEGISPSENLVDLTTVRRSWWSNRKWRSTDWQMNYMLSSFQRSLGRYARRLQTSMRRVQTRPNRYHHNGGRMGGSGVPLQSGPGTKGWFTKIDLPRNEVIGYVAQFENLGTYQTGKIAWVPANVFTVDDLTIPVGSKLLLGAWIRDWDWRSVTLNVNGQSHRLRFMDTHVEEFPTAGNYVITATHRNGRTATLNVDVREAVLPDHLSVGEQRYFNAALPNVAADLRFDTNEEVPHTGLASAAVGSTTRLSGQVPGQYRAAARLSPTQNGGRGTILDQTETYVVGVSDALRHGSDSVSPLDEDLFLVRSPLLVLHLPPGATIEAVVFAGGVTFPDGTTTKALTATDLDDNGVYTLDFHVPRERLGAPCHYINIYNVAGQKIWSSTQ